MRVLTSALALAVLACAPMALAQTDTPPAETSEPTIVTESTETAEAPAEEVAATEAAVEAEQVCRTIERSESRLRSRRERVCRTQAEWDALQQQRQGNRGGQPDNN